MGKYGKMGHQAPPPQRPWQVHPIWRGIGCLLVLIAPPVAFAGANVLYDMNLERGWQAVPYELARAYTIPGLSITVPHALGSLVLTVLLLLIGFAVMMIIYAAVYALLGPPRYGPLDSPPVREKRR